NRPGRDGRHDGPADPLDHPRDVPGGERGKAYGLFGAVVGCASSAGTIVGGLLVQWDVFHLEWRAIFLVNVPIGLAAVLAGRFVIGESRSPGARRVDLVGAALALAVTVLLAYPLTEGRALGWPGWSFGMMLVALFLLAVLVSYERRRARRIGSPLVVLSLFRAKTFSAGTALLVIFAVSF